MPKTFREMADDELIEEAKSRHFAVYEMDCYNSRDVYALDGAIAELEKRGYRVYQTLAVEKVEDFEEELVEG